MSRKHLPVQSRKLGEGAPCYIIAEIGNNHDGSAEKARELIRAAAESGADAVKFQTFKAEDIVSPNIPSDAYPGYDVSDRFDRWIDFVRSFELSYESYPELVTYAHQLGVDFISTPASFAAVDFLSELKIDMLKIASMDLNNIPMIRRAMRSNLPLIVSTGMATLSEIEATAKLLADYPFALLHCVSLYPLPEKDANLRNISLLLRRFDVPIGFSNHALSADLDIAAVSLGACILERHITFQRTPYPSAEHHMSMEIQEFAEMVKRVRVIELALGTDVRILSPEEEKYRELARRSVTSRRKILSGEIIAEKDLILLRPGTGIAPQFFEDILGASAARDIGAFEALTWADIDKSSTTERKESHELFS